MVGGGGEKKTLRSVARHADMWNAQAPLRDIPRKLEALRAHCADVGRDPADDRADLQLQDRHPRPHRPTPRPSSTRSSRPTHSLPAPEEESFWAGTVEEIAERLASFVALGFRTFTIEELAPFDRETFERLIGEVKPLLEGR